MALPRLMSTYFAPLAHVAIAPGHVTLEVVLCVLGAAVLYVLEVMRGV